MTILESRGISHYARLNWTALQVLQTVTDVQVDGSLAADVVAVRRRLTWMDDQGFLIQLTHLLCLGLVETEVWSAGWKCWATRHGWATVIEAEEQP